MKDKYVVLPPHSKGNPSSRHRVVNDEVRKTYNYGPSRYPTGETFGDAAAAEKRRDEKNEGKA